MTASILKLPHSNDLMSAVGHASGSAVVTCDEDSSLTGHDDTDLLATAGTSLGDGLSYLHQHLIS